MKGMPKIRNEMVQLIRTVLVVTIVLASGFMTSVQSGPPFSGKDAARKRVLVLGDSITYGGFYVDLLDLAFTMRFPDQSTEILNLGLPSETVSGLSEDGHAGGRFPRPDLFERVDRVLEQVKPDVVFTCYGMNCGIYQPLSSGNGKVYLDRYRQLLTKIEDAGAIPVIITPPPFDPLPIIKRTSPDGKGGPFSGYDAVLQTFSAGLVREFSKEFKVIDINSPMTEYVIRRRIEEPEFRLANDGVHMGQLGNFLAFQQIIVDLGFSIGTYDSGAWNPSRYIYLPSIDGVNDPLQQNFEKLFNHIPQVAQQEKHPERDKELFNKIRARQKIRKDAWLTKTGHKRPGMRKLEPFEEHMAEADKIGKEIRMLMDNH